MLESALHRPRDRLAYAPESSLATLAAAYAFGIAKNHAFLDGNKRTAWACCVLFLRINGVLIKVDAAAAVTAMVDLATGGFSEPDFAVWQERRVAAA